MTDHVYGTGELVQSPQLHGIFGTVVGVRAQHRTGRGWGEVEYNVSLGPGHTSWIDVNALSPASLDNVTEHYRRLMRKMQEDHAAELAELTDDTYALD